MFIENRISSYALMLLMGLHVLIFALLNPVLGVFIVSSFFLIMPIMGLILEFYSIKKNFRILDWSDEIIPQIIIIAIGLGFFLLITFTTSEILFSFYLSNSFLTSGIFFLILGIRDKKRKPELEHKRSIRSMEETQKHLKEIDIDFKRIKEIPLIIKSKEFEIEKINNKDLQFELFHEEDKNILREIKSLNKELSSLKKKYRLRLIVDSELKELKSKVKKIKS